MPTRRRASARDVVESLHGQPRDLRARPLADAPHADAAARNAFNQARARVPGHPMATLGLEILDGMSGEAASGRGFDPTGSMAGERALAHAVRMSHAGDRAAAARLIAAAVRTAPAGSTGWLIPIEPLLGMRESPELFAGALEQLSQRAL